MADMNELIEAIETVRKRMQDCSSEPPVLFLNEAEYVYFKVHEWIDFEGGRFTNAQCAADTGIPAHIEIRIQDLLPR